jgi:pimeloyl-ACP methyl ester carboxylesterase
MQEGLIGQWLKREGDRVEQGEELVEIETEKITNVVEAPVSGILARILHPAGSTIPVTQVIAIITAPDEDLQDFPRPGQDGQNLGSADELPGKPQIQGGPSSKQAVERQVVPAQTAHIRAMPAARRLAKERGLDLAAIQGSGPDGIITREDVEQFLAVPTIRPLQKVSFFSEGCRLAGLLYTPDNLAPGEKRPAVVLCVGYTYIKEMVMPDIAKALNRAGYVALLFDYRGFGESEGPRWRLMPHEQTQDIRAALTFIADQPQVDPNYLAIVGLSLGGAHAVTVGALDQRVGAVVAIEPVGNGERWLRSLRRYSEWLEFQAQLAGDRLLRVRTGNSERVDPLAIVIPDLKSRAFLEAVLQEFPQMKCDLSLETAEALIEYSPEEVVEQIAPRPILFIHGANDQMVPVDESHNLFKRAGEPRRLEVISGLDHFDWVMPHSPGFSQITGLVTNFLQEFLPVQ